VILKKSKEMSLNLCVMSMRTMRTNNERTNLNLNSNIEHIDQNKTIRNKKIRTWNVQPKMQTNFYCDKTWNVNTKRIKLSYWTILYLVLVLNILKVMEVLLSFIHFWGPSSRKFPWRCACAHQSINFLKGFLTSNELGIN
jgi:hypothetical protein